MKQATIFYLSNCPYCHKAQKALEELKNEDPVYGEIAIKWIEESREPVLAAKYDYYYVPSVYEGENKLYECSPAEDYASIKDNLRKALNALND